MGIPHLTSQIRPFAKIVSWQCQKANVGQNQMDDHEDLVIDGPSLAYHIYHCCLAAKHGTRNALEAVPTYQELGNAVIDWLEKVENFGLRVKQIYFDGFLPVPKNNIRYDRLAKSLLQLRNYHSLNPYLHAKGVTRTLLYTSSPGLQKAPSRPTPVPASPFLVPAIIDALFGSRYKTQTHVVPCEAEVECAKGSNNIILTNDSDLILLAGSNRIIFFNDLEIHQQAQPGDVLSGLYYDAANISAKLNCPDLIQLAFFLTQEPTKPLQDLAKKANDPTLASETLPAEYADFKSAFTPQIQYSQFAWAAEPNTAFSRALNRLDPRISEFVQQWGAALGNPTFPLQNRSVVPQTTASASRHMFLPFLLDDPTRASAWRASGEVRCLAYSIMALYGPRFEMMEVDRRGERILGTQVQLIVSATAVVDACENLLGALPSATGDLLGASERWLLVALFRALAALMENDYSLPTRAVVRHVFDGSMGVKEWAHVHLSAQIEGFIYSLRILCQFLEVWMAAAIPQEPAENRIVFASLLDSLRRLPALSEVLGRAGGGFTLSDIGLEELERGLIEFYGVEGERVSMGEDFVEDKRKKKKRRKNEHSDGEKREKLVSTNMYNLLEES